MAKEHKHKETETVTEITTTTATIEEPKVKVGDKVEVSTTTVDTKEKKERKPRTPKGVGTYRILDGVDATKFVGQRGAVIRSLQNLSAGDPEGSFSLSQIVSNTEGLVSRTPIEDSVKYHLNLMVKDNIVTLILPPTPVADESTAA